MLRRGLLGLSLVLCPLWFAGCERADQATLKEKFQELAERLPHPEGRGALGEDPPGDHPRSDPDASGGGPPSTGAPATSGLPGPHPVTTPSGASVEDAPAVLAPTPPPRILPAGQVPSFKALYRRAAASVVDVVPSEESAASPALRLFGADPEWRGAGFIVAVESLGADLPGDADRAGAPPQERQRAFVVTNQHLIRDESAMRISLSDGRDFEAKLRGRDPDTNMAVLEIVGAQLPPPLALATRAATEVGAWVLVVGSPFGLSQTVTKGIVSALGRREVGTSPTARYADYIQIDAAVNPGNSGGPVLNLSGEVVGIATLIGDERPGIGFAIPSYIVSSIWPQLRDFGRVRRARIGIHIREVAVDEAADLGLDPPRGAFVSHVGVGGPADQAGIEAGDVIVDFDGHPLRLGAELPWLVARAIIEKPVPVGLWRDRSRLEVLLVPKER